MFAYDQILEPTTVSHSLVSNFTTFQYDELIVVCTNILKIFHVIDCATEGSGPGSKVGATTKQLTLKHEFPLVTPCITSLQRIPGSAKLFQYDKLVIGTGDKLSVVQFNDVTQSLETKSLHYYVDSFRKKDETDDNGVARIRAMDGIESCVLFKSNSLVHLRYFQQAQIVESEKREEEEEEDEEGAGGKDEDVEDMYSGKHSNKKRKYQPKSLALKSNTVYSDLKNIIDFQNDGGSLLYFLYSPNGLKWAGSETHNSVKLICLNMLSSSDNGDSKASFTNKKQLNSSLKTQLTSSTMINSIDGLSDDMHSIVPIQDQPGSVLLIGVNQILLVDENFNVKVIYKLNSYCDISSLQRKFNCNKVFSIFDDSGKQKQVELQKNVSHVWLNSQNSADGHYVLVVDYLIIQLMYRGKICTGMKITNISDTDTSHSWQNITSISNLELQSSLTTVSKHSSNDLVFFAFAKGDCVLVNFNTLTEKTSAKKDQEKLEQDEDDDIYNVESFDSMDYRVVTKIQDHVLPNFGPVTSMCIAPTISSSGVIKGLKNPNFGEHSFIACGASSTTCLYEIQPSVQPIVERGFKFVDVTKIWNLDNTYLITTDSKKMRSDIFLINKNFKTFKPLGFESRSCTTVDIQMSVSRENIIHVTNKAIYIFGYNFEEKSRLLFKGARAEVIHVSIQDDFILTTNVKGEIGIYELFEDELYEITLPTGLNELILTSGSIMKTNMVTSTSVGGDSLIFSFVTADNHLIFFYKDHDNKIFEFDGVCDLTHMLKMVPYEIPEEIIPDPFIKQVMITAIGNDIVLTVLTFEGEVYMYKQREGSLTTEFDKLNDGCVLTGGSSDIEQNMYYLENFQGKKVILISGVQPFIIMNELNNQTRCYKFGNVPLMSLSVWFDENNVGTKLMSVDNIKNARIMRLDVDNVYYGCKLPIKRHLIEYNGEIKENQALIEFNNVALHRSSGTVCVSFFQPCEYVARDTLGEPLVVNPDFPTNAFESMGKTFTGGMLLLKYDVAGRCFQMLDEYLTKSSCMVNCLESMKIQVLHVDERISMSSTSINASAIIASSSSLSSNSKDNLTTPITHQSQHEYLVLGETYLRDEDLHGRSRLLIVDISNGKFQVSYRDDSVRGGMITCLAACKGRIVYNESNKLWVRKVLMKNGALNSKGGLNKKKMLLEPVAFYDIPSIPTKISEFNSLILTSTFHNGLYLNGLEMEPYRFIPFSKSSMGNVGSLNNEILVNQGDCYQLNCNELNELSISKFANDDPLSFNGTKLMEWSSYRLGATTSVMHTIPTISSQQQKPTMQPPQMFFNNMNNNNNKTNAEYMSLGCGLDGNIYSVIPLKETSYRRLNIVQQQIIEKNVQICGMNYKLERLPRIISVSSYSEDPHQQQKQQQQQSSKTTRNNIIDLPLIKANFVNASMIKRNKLTTLRIGAHATTEIWKDLINCNRAADVFQSL